MTSVSDYFLVFLYFPFTDGTLGTVKADADFTSRLPSEW